MSTIDDLKRKVQSLTDQLKEARQSLLNAELAACPIKIGMIVIYAGIEYRVTMVNPELRGKKNYWLRGNRRRKDGTFGTADHRLFDDWELPPEK